MGLEGCTWHETYTGMCVWGVAWCGVVACAPGQGHVTFTKFHNESNMLWTEAKQIVFTINFGRDGSLQPSKRLRRVSVPAHLSSNTSIGSLCRQATRRNAAHTPSQTRAGKRVCGGGGVIFLPHRWSGPLVKHVNVPVTSRGLLPARVLPRGVFNRLTLGVGGLGGQPPGSPGGVGGYPNIHTSK